MCARVCTGPSSVEESKAQCLSGLDQERGGEEDDGETDDVGGRFSSQKERQNLQRDCGGEVSAHHYNPFSLSVCLFCLFFLLHDIPPLIFYVYLKICVKLV